MSTHNSQYQDEYQCFYQHQYIPIHFTCLTTMKSFSLPFLNIKSFKTGRLFIAEGTYMSLVTKLTCLFAILCRMYIEVCMWSSFYALCQSVMMVNVRHPERTEKYWCRTKPHRCWTFFGRGEYLSSFTFEVGVLSFSIFFRYFLNIFSR